MCVAGVLDIPGAVLSLGSNPSRDLILIIKQKISSLTFNGSPGKMNAILERFWRFYALHFALASKPGKLALFTTY